MTRTQTIAVTQTPGDARAAAEVVAANLRNAGNDVTIGDEYTLPQGTHKAGLLAVDLVIKEPDTSTSPPTESVSAGEPVAPADFRAPVETSSVVMATADGFDEEIVVPFSDEPVLTLAEEYPRLVQPAPAKNKGGRPRKVQPVVVADGTRGMERGR